MAWQLTPTRICHNAGTPCYYDIHIGRKISPNSSIVIKPSGNNLLKYTLVKLFAQAGKFVGCMAGV
jgi:hypothetical protein